MKELCREFEPYGQEILGVGHRTLVCWELCGPGRKFAVVLAAPAVCDNIVLELRTEASRGVEIFNGLLPLGHPEKHAERFAGGSL